MIKRPAGGASARGGNNRPAANRTLVATNRRPTAFNVREFVRSVFLELRRVTWPSNEEWISATILTIALVIGIGLFTFTVDWIFGQIFQLIHPA